MAVQVVAVIATILDHRWPAVQLQIAGLSIPLNIELVAKLTIWAMVLLSVVSAADYFVTFWTKIDQAHKQGAPSVRPVPARHPTKVTSIGGKQGVPIQ
jgi:hypothetical protein